MKRQGLKNKRICYASHPKTLPALSLLTFVQEDYVIDSGRLRFNYDD